MKKRTLAKALRRQQIAAWAKGELPTTRKDWPRIVRSLSDHDIIWSYVTCSNCGAAPSPTELENAIRQACCVAEFFSLLDHMGIPCADEGHVGTPE
jgi:hypothetical protein